MVHWPKGSLVQKCVMTLLGLVVSVMVSRVRVSASVGFMVRMGIQSASGTLLSALAKRYILKPQVAAHT